MKVLIISHNPISMYQSMGMTLHSLFTAFRKEELCQLYIYPTSPNVAKCNSYLRISDIDALKGIFKLKVEPVNVKVEEKEYSKQLFYGNNRNRSHVRELIRDMIWLIAPWYNRELNDWIKKECPTHIFIAPGRGKFLYNIALKISNEYNIPIITYICDDYYNLSDEFLPIGIIWQKKLRRKIKQLINKSMCVVTICDELAELYHKQFHCPTLTVMTGSSCPIVSPSIQNNYISSITYLGNIGLNRYVSLIEVANALDEISKNGHMCYLDIYTGGVNDEFKDELKKYSRIRLHDFVIGEAYKQVFNNAEAFLYVEAFDDVSINRVKNSISTKIPDILASGKIVLAYGPTNISSMKHLSKNNCAIIVNDKSELKDALMRLIYNIGDINTKMVNNALMVAKKYHDAEASSEMMRKIFK